MPEKKPVHEDVPVDDAWVVGRRIYVRCPKDSQLNRELMTLGANWDWEVRARWVGTGKRDAVVPLVRADQQRRQAEKQATAELLAAGRWVQLPRDVAGVATAMHPRAGELGAAWDAENFRYALPSDDNRAQLQQQLDTWLAEQQADRERTEAERQARQRAAAEEQARLDEAEKRAAAEEAEQRRARIVADSGRTLTGETQSLHRISTRYMNRATAESTAWRPGSVHRLRDGRRGLVVARKIWFTNADDATDLCWHPEAPDEAHWDFQYELEIVEPTATELQTDAEAAAVVSDAAALHVLFRELGRGARVVTAFTQVPDTDRTGTIRGHASTPGVASTVEQGTVILTADGRVVCQYPGHYDTGDLTEAITTDPEQVARVRTLLDAGTRTRNHHDQLTYTYTVTR